MSVYVRKFGRNADIDIADAPEDIWVSGGLYSWPSAAAATTIESDDAADAAGGTGARTCEVEGLNADYHEVKETVTLNGATPVTLSNQFLRVYRVRALQVGSGGINAGNIDVKHGSTVLARVAAEYGQTLQAVYTVPVRVGQSGQGQIEVSEGRILSFDASQGGAAGAESEITLYARNWNAALSAYDSWQVKESFILEATGTSYYEYVYRNPISVAPRTDIRLTVLSVGADDTKVTGGFEIELRIGTVY